MSKNKIKDGDSFFDLTEGTSRKEEGKNLTAENRKFLLTKARAIAVLIANSRPSKLVNADDVQKALMEQGYEPAQLGNAAGSIFRGEMWLKRGYENSKRKTNHARVIMSWEYIPSKDIKNLQKELF